MGSYIFIIIIIIIIIYFLNTELQYRIIPYITIHYCFTMLCFKTLHLLWNIISEKKMKSEIQNKVTKGRAGTRKSKLAKNRKHKKPK